MDASQLLKSYQELFYKCYIENNILESEITTDQDIELLEDLQPDEVFDNFKDLCTISWNSKEESLLARMGPW